MAFIPALIGSAISAIGSGATAIGATGVGSALTSAGGWVSGLAGAGGAAGTVAQTLAHWPGMAPAAAEGMGAAAVSVPASTSILGSGLTLGSALKWGGLLTSALGTMGAGSAEADVMRQNAEIARKQGMLQEEAGKRDTLTLSRQKRQLIGKQRAAFAANSGSVSGTDLDVMAESARAIDEDIQLAGWQGATEQALSERQAKIYEWAARKRRGSSLLGAGTTLLTGIGESLLNRRR